MQQEDSMVRLEMVVVAILVASPLI
jgi:hypothetical protein